MNYNELSKRAHANAVNKGFWAERNSNEHCLMLVITEISEMVEADRHDKHADRLVFRIGEESDIAFEKFIKDTVEDEMADTAIRLFDLSGNLGIDFDRMNKCRYYRAYDKFSFTENAFGLAKGLARDIVPIEKRMQFGLDYVFSWAKSLGIDLEWHIAKKMAYNESRPTRHGKKY